VGNQTDNSAQVSGTLSWATGSFPSVTGAPVGLGSFSLQLNTNTFTTSACSSAANPAICQGWQQFIYAGTDSSGQVFMQYWLLQYGNPCPSGWTSFQDMFSCSTGCCYKNSLGADVGPLAGIHLDSVTLTGSATPGGWDQATLWYGNSANALGFDSMLNLAAAWNTAEFNIFGNCCGASYSFPSGVTLLGKIDVWNGTTAAPICTLDGTTGETNNLNLVPAGCCASGGSPPSITFLESNVAGAVPPFCLANDITPIMALSLQ
jgi:hypothetical protein